MIALLDYGAGNLRSVARAVEHLGYHATLTSDPDVVRRADVLIVPGQGAAGECMRCLNDLHLTGVIKDYIATGRP
ncbi:MAG: imidazole glycerol phosphate synthase subunit HisH, partial [Chloroflexi bacterium]|nr:imidazole glycerol phosphate synthase subunit HisH [Chloroflexota bacterium]